MTEHQKNFIETVGKLARSCQYADKILPSVTIAQAILESGWGNSSLTVKANALFGIKAGKNWKGKVYSCKTQECYDGVNFTTETACFRAYASWAESIADHGAFLCRYTRYRHVLGQRDYRLACAALKSAGYATDPAYDAKLITLIENYDLTRFDSFSGNAAAPAKAYTIRRGDTLTKIAAAHSTTVAAIVENNRTRYPSMTRDYIQAGWTIRV
jgi:flagellum-specific peptidoglycan hydrolase FlgJ